MKKAIKNAPVRLFIRCFFVLLVTHFSTFASVQPENLRCEYLENPLGIGIRKPRFNWIITSSVPNIRQTAYELLVSEQKEELEENRGSQWYSGKIKEEGSIQVIYKGNPLKPFTRYFWKVRIFDEHDIPSSWSEIQWFETAMLSPEDWEAQWIGNGQPQFQNDEEFYQEDPMPLFRKEFTIQKQIRSARLYICGLGYHEAYLNGEKIGDHVLDPGWTAHKKQNLYVTHDITGLIRKGKNTTGIMLGNGWYNPLPLQLFARFNIRDHQQTGRPVVKAQIHLNYMDGSTEIIQTDNSWFTTQGPVIKNNVYLGEHYDGRWEVPDWNKNKVSLSGWRAAVIEKGPDGELSPQIQPAVKIQEIIRPVHIWKTRDNTFIVDMGINFAGVARIKVKGRSGTKITLRYGENIHPDSTLNWLTTTAGHIKSMWGMKGGPGAPEDAYQEDSYILHGNGRETYMPRFTFHGFRYVEIIGWPGTPTKEEIEGIRMYADLETNGTFTCSNELFNQLHEITQRTFLSNVFSVQSDCPGREKMGYGGDMVVTGESYLYNYNMANFYRKTIRDFINDQTPEGGMTGIAPYTGIADRGIGGESGSLGWQLAFPYLQKKLYEFYGDKQTIEISYPAFVKQMEFIQRQTIGELFHWDIGDHVAIDPRAEAFSACAFYYEHARLITEFAAILGKKEDQEKYQLLTEQIRNNIIKKYLVPGTGKFDNATQAAQIFALYYGLSPEPEKTFQVLLDEYARHNWHISTGIFACKMGFDVLREHNRNDIAYRLVNQRDYPGWGYMVENGATTLWESWEYPENASSQNHPMFGSTEEWFYRSLLGINPLQPGFKEIMIKPQPAGDLKWVQGSYHSMYGLIRSAWRITEKEFQLEVEIPANTTARIYLPATNQESIACSSGYTYAGEQDGYSICLVNSGKYTFTCQ